jgi:hypothetical protein
MNTPLGILGKLPPSNPFANILAPIPDPDTPYFEALGRFIVAYAGAEVAVHQLARKVSGLKDRRARVLFAGMRIGDVTTRMRALVRLSNRAPKIKNNIESCLAQFDIIGTQRDKMVHRWTSYSGGALSVTNILTSKSVLEYEQDLFSITDLQRLHLDCLAISIRLNGVAHPASLKGLKRHVRKYLYGPWQYKPAPLKTPRKQNQAQAIVEALHQPPAS